MRNRSGAREFGDGGKQFARVCVLGLVENLFGEADFEESAPSNAAILEMKMEK